MSVPTHLPSTNVYAVRLIAMDPKNPGLIAGRIEHVLSGRCRDFADGAALLACLALEQRQATPAAQLACAIDRPPAPEPLSP